MRSFGEAISGNIGAGCGRLDGLAALVIGTLAAYALARFRWPGDWGGKLSFLIPGPACCRRSSPSRCCSWMMWQAGLPNSAGGARHGLYGVQLAVRDLDDARLFSRTFRWNWRRRPCWTATSDGRAAAGGAARARPGLAATAIFRAPWRGTNFCFAPILTADRCQRQRFRWGLRSRVTQYEIQWGAMSAAGVAMAMVPVLIRGDRAENTWCAGCRLAR